MDAALCALWPELPAPGLRGGSRVAGGTLLPPPTEAYALSPVANAPQELTYQITALHRHEAGRVFVGCVHQVFFIPFRFSG